VTRVVFVCLGNICRSPMAEVVMRAMVEQAGLAGEIEIASAGTGDWHIGEPADPRALETLRSAGYDGSRHRGRQFDATWFADHDLVLAMDRSNLEALRRLASPDEAPKVRLLTSYDAVEPDAEVPDPYYGGDDGFPRVLAMIERSCAGLIEAIRRGVVT
jgi:protein-tyrosine phosphatase